jgi:hypothetical protein
VANRDRELATLFGRGFSGATTEQSQAA